MGSGLLCEGCSLQTIGQGFVPFEVGERYSGLAIIGEAAGFSEMQEGKPFRPYAVSGALLADAMREMMISRSELAITNCISCHPPKDFLVGAPWEVSALQHCHTRYLHDFIQTTKPKAILAVGSVALSQLTERPKGKYGMLEALRGYVMKGAGAATGIPVIGTFHPSFLRQGSPELIPCLQRDLRRAFLLAQGKMKEGIHYSLDPYSLGLNYQTSPTLDECWEWYRAMDYSFPLSLDIETPRTTREEEDTRTSFADRDIKLIQFSQRKNEGIALPWRDEFIDVAKAILKTPTRKLGHNLANFDLPVLRMNDVEVDLSSGYDDTMWMFHHYQPDLPANLQAAAQWFGFRFPWKSIGETDLPWYGCADVDSAIWVAEGAEKSLKDEGLWDSYIERVKKVHPVLVKMSTRGVPVNEEEREKLGSLLISEKDRVDLEIQALIPQEVLSSKQKNGYKNPPILICECGWKGRVDHECMTYAELAEINGLTLREVVIEGDSEKCRCSKKERGNCAMCVGSGIIPAGTIEMRWASLLKFKPNSRPQVIRYCKFKKYPVPKHAKRVDAQGEASDTTEVKELERLAIKTKDPFFRMVIEGRQIGKMRGTYYEGMKPWPDGAVHTTYTFGPATAQTASKDPNVQNQPKRSRSEFQKKLVAAYRGMIKVRDGKKLLNFDYKAFHALTTGFEAGLPDYMRLARIDIHSFNAVHFLKLPERVGLYERDDEDMAALFKHLRKNETFSNTRNYKTKAAGLGIGFGMGYRKLYQMYKEDFDSESDAKKAWELIMVELFPGLAKFHERIRQRAAEDKKLISRAGFVRRFWDVVKWNRNKQKWEHGDQAEQAVAFLPANDAFAHVRNVLRELDDLGYAEKYGLFNQVHDSLEFECPIELVEECKENVRRIMMMPSREMVDPILAPTGLIVDVDVMVGDSLIDMK